MNSFIKENQKHNIRFVDTWARYVCTHPDKEWSHQQNIIINSSVRNASLTKEEYFAMKQEKYRKSNRTSLRKLQGCTELQNKEHMLKDIEKKRDELRHRRKQLTKKEKQELTALVQSRKKSITYCSKVH